MVFGRLGVPRQTKTTHFQETNGSCFQKIMWPKTSSGFPNERNHAAQVPRVPVEEKLPGGRSGFRAGFRPDSNRKSFKIDPPAGHRPAGGPNLKLSRRNPARKPDVRHGSTIRLKSDKHIYLKLATIVDCRADRQEDNSATLSRSVSPQLEADARCESVRT